MERLISISICISRSRSRKIKTKKIKTSGAVALRDWIEPSMKDFDVPPERIWLQLLASWILIEGDIGEGLDGRNARLRSLWKLTSTELSPDARLEMITRTLDIAASGSNYVNEVMKRTVRLLRTGFRSGGEEFEGSKVNGGCTMKEGHEEVLPFPKQSEDNETYWVCDQRDPDNPKFECVLERGHQGDCRMHSTSKLKVWVRIYPAIRYDDIGGEENNVETNGVLSRKWGSS
jgi:hypothetical protein